MSASFRRFEILLPRRFNDGPPVPDELIADTLLEIEGRFGAVSSETQSIQGHWRYGEQLYRDDLIRVFVDTPDTPESLEFFVDFKERVKERFQQIDIWLTHTWLRSCDSIDRVRRADGLQRRLLQVP